MNIKACIFDLDGVIVDTAKFHYLAWRELSNELGFDFSEEQNEQLKGVSRMRSLEILLEIGGLNFDEQKKIELATKKNERYVELIQTLTPEDILPGVNNFLNEIKQQNLKTALGSASKNAMTILQRIGLDTYFDVVIDGNKVTKAKPDPEVFTLAADELHIPYNQCVVFEDSQAGITAAKTAGMFAIGIGKPENLKNADIVITNFLDFSLDKL